MTAQLVTVAEYSCPLCGKPLQTQEYNIAIEELKKKEAVSYEVQNRKMRAEYQEKLTKKEQEYKAELDALKKGNVVQLEKLQNNLKESYQQQTEVLRKSYQQLNEENQGQFEIMKVQMQEAHTRALEERNKQMQELIDGQARFKKLAKEEAATSAKLQIEKMQTEITERDVQLLRFQHEVEDLKKQVSQSQAELKGEAGELDLYAALTSSFTEDLITRQKRGTASGDLIHRIRTMAGELEMPIVYDNKEAISVTKQDIEKAKKYKRIHKTDYILIVSCNLPKKDVPNGLYGEREGILLVHPSIVLEVARQIRSALIEISRQAKSNEDRKSKQAKLYDYVRSKEFHDQMTELSEIYRKSFELQNKEEKYHQTLWKERKAMIDHLMRTCNEMESGIDIIIQENATTQSTNIDEPGIVEDCDGDAR